jgi:hypothetical protein
MPASMTSRHSAVSALVWSDEVEIAVIVKAESRDEAELDEALAAAEALIAFLPVAADLEDAAAVAVERDAVGERLARPRPGLAEAQAA